jgi:hypothetical protein
MIFQSCPSNWDRAFFVLSRKNAIEKILTKEEKIMAEEKKIPYKIYLEEDEMPKAWYNVRADMKNKPAPLLNPGTHQPMTAEELEGVFLCRPCCTELDNENPYIEIPQEIRDFYKMYRPSPLVRAFASRKSCRPRKDFTINLR